MIYKFDEPRQHFVSIHDFLLENHERIPYNVVIHQKVALMTIDKRIKLLKDTYLELAKGKKNLLRIITEAEIPEMVFNSNAIENSTLSLEETERVLLELELSRYVTARELLEAKNLARIINYLENKKNEVPINTETILFFHKMLLSGIDDSIAGRFRNEDEFVRVGKHVAPNPDQVEKLINKAIDEYNFTTLAPLEAIAVFHLEFERIHPFCDGNGRTGRVILNMQLSQHNFPPVIIRNNEKYGAYYPFFDRYNIDRSSRKFTEILKRYVSESLNKRIAYLEGREINKVSEYSKTSERSIQSLLNSAKRQTLEAFRQHETWMIGT